MEDPVGEPVEAPQPPPDLSGVCLWDFGSEQFLANSLTGEAVCVCVYGRDGCVRGGPWTLLFDGTTPVLQGQGSDEDVQ